MGEWRELKAARKQKLVSKTFCCGLLDGNVCWCWCEMVSLEFVLIYEERTKQWCVFWSFHHNFKAEKEGPSLPSYYLSLTHPTHSTHPTIKQYAVQILHKHIRYTGHHLITMHRHKTRQLSKFFHWLNSQPGQSIFFSFGNYSATRTSLSESEKFSWSHNTFSVMIRWRQKTREKQLLRGWLAVQMYVCLNYKIH